MLLEAPECCEGNRWKPDDVYYRINSRLIKPELQCAEAVYKTKVHYKVITLH